MVKIQVSIGMFIIPNNCCISNHQPIYFCSGNKIHNTPASYPSRWIYDNRYYFHLFYGKFDNDEQDCASDEQNDAYNLGSEEFQRFAFMLDIRLKVWAAIRMDAVDQLFDMSEAFNDKAIICGCKYNQLNECEHSATSKEHLYTRGLSLVYGGFSNRKELVDQMCHCDILDMTPEAGGSISLSENPLLENKCRPFVMMVPVTASAREIYFMDTQMRKKKVLIEQNEALLFGGNTVHGGVTYAGDEKSDLKPVLHVLFQSYYHNPDVKEDTITMFPAEIAANDPTFLRILSNEKQLEGIKHHMDVVVKAFPSCIKKNNKKKINHALIQYLVESMQKLTNAMNNKRKVDS